MTMIWLFLNSQGTLHTGKGEFTKPHDPLFTNI